MKISDVLRHKGHLVTTVQQTDVASAVVKVLAAKRIGAVVVQDRWQKIVGIFSERDLVNGLARLGPDVLGFAVSELMSSPVLTCHSDERVDAALATMTMNKVRHLPVVDKDHLAGIVSIGDLVHHRLDEKELEAGVLLDITRMHH